MNNFRKVAEFCRINGIEVSEIEVKGTGGGFDDATLLSFHHGLYELCQVEISGYDKKDIDPAILLDNLKLGLEQLQTVGVFDEDTLIRYLLNNRKKERKS